MADGTTAPESMLKAREAAIADFEQFKSTALERFRALANKDRSDERMTYLLDRYGLGIYFERDPAWVVGEMARTPFIVAFAVLIPENATDSPVMVPSDTRRVGLSYVQLPNGEVDVEIVDPRPLGAVIRPHAIHLATVPAAALQDDRVLASHWAVLRRTMQVTWRDGCPTRITRWLDSWFRYAHAHYTGERWLPSELSTHLWAGGRWIAMVGCSGALVVAAQAIFQPPPPKDTVSPTLQAEGQKAREAMTALRGEVADVRAELVQLRNQLSHEQATAPSVPPTVTRPAATKSAAHRPKAHHD